MRAVVFLLVGRFTSLPKNTCIYKERLFVDCITAFEQDKDFEIRFTYANLFFILLVSD